MFITAENMSWIQGVKCTQMRRKERNTLVLQGFGCPRGGLGIPIDRDQRSWVFPNNPKNTLPLNAKNTFNKVKP